MIFEKTFLCSGNPTQLDAFALMNGIEVVANQQSTLYQLVLMQLVFLVSAAACFRFGLGHISWEKMTKDLVWTWALYFALWNVDGRTMPRFARFGSPPHGYAPHCFVVADEVRHTIIWLDNILGWAAVSFLFAVFMLMASIVFIAVRDTWAVFGWNMMLLEYVNLEEEENGSGTEGEEDESGEEDETGGGIWPWA